MKIDGYWPARRDRTTPRTSDGSLRGGGVLILVSTAYENLSFEALPPIDLGLDTDTTTELVRARLCCEQKGKPVSIDVLNIYIPPITGTADAREQHFSAVDTFTSAYDDYGQKTAPRAF